MSAAARLLLAPRLEPLGEIGLAHGPELGLELDGDGLVWRADGGDLAERLLHPARQRGRSRRRPSGECQRVLEQPVVVNAAPCQAVAFGGLAVEDVAEDDGG